MSEVEPLITPPPALGPPIIGTDPASAPGIPQPVFKSGSATAPAPPIPITGAPILPPPLITNPPGVPVFPPTGANQAPVTVPVGPLVGPAVAPAGVPPSVPGVQQPVFKTGSATVPTAASLFPEFTTGAPSPPIVFANIFKIGTVPPPLPTTPGVAPIVISTAPAIPQLPWSPPNNAVPINTVRPAITGTTTVGQTLTASTGTWTNATSYAYEWLQNGSPIAGAHSATLALAASEAHAMISCIVTATGAGGEASAESLEVGPIASALRDEPIDDPAPTQRAEPRHTPKPTSRKKR